MRIQIIPLEQQPAQSWKNGAGSTREIVRVGPESAFEWRASLARIDASGPFSQFPGYRRWSCLVDGGPLTLIAEDAPNITLDPRMRAFSYSGDDARSGLLLGPQAQVFNLIAQADRVDAQIIPRPLVGHMVIFCTPHTSWLVYLSSGSAQLIAGEQRWQLSSGDAALIEANGQNCRAVLEGGGEVVLSKVEER